MKLSHQYNSKALIKTIIIIFILTSNYLCISQNYKVENKIFKCISSSLKQSGVNLEDEINKFEKHLIQNNILHNSSGDSYLKMYKQIGDNEIIYDNLNYSFNDSIKYDHFILEYKHSKSECINLQKKIGDTNYYKKSKLFLLNHAFDSLRLIQEMELNVIMNTIANILSAKDFENNYYKFFALTSISAIANTSLELDYKENRVYEEEIYNSIKIDINCTVIDDSIFFNNNKIAINNLAPILKNHILHLYYNTNEEYSSTSENIPNKSHYVITLNNYRNIAYITFINIQNEVFKAKELIYNELSEIHFNKSYNLLSEDKKHTIESLIVIHIKE